MTALAGRLGLAKSTVSRLLSSLARHELVTYDPAGRCYRRGPALLRLREAAFPELELVPVLRPALQRLAERTGATVALAVLRGGLVHALEQAHGSRILAGVDVGGRGLPAHASASGKVLLASAPDGVREAVLAGGLPALTPHSVTEPGLLRAELVRIVRTGLAVERDELEEGLSSLAAPVRDLDDSAWAAVSASVPSHRLDPAREAALVRVQQVAGVVSRALDLGTGAPEPSAQALRMDGLTDAAGVPPTSGALFESLHPEHRDWVAAAWARAAERGRLEIAHRIVLDGETRRVRVLGEREHEDSAGSCGLTHWLARAEGKLASVTAQHEAVHGAAWTRGQSCAEGSSAEEPRSPRRSRSARPRTMSAAGTR